MMVRKSLVVPISTLVLLLTLATVSAAKHAQVPVMRLHADTEIAAPLAVVWSHLTTGKSLVASCPVWKNEKNASVKITKVGDVLDYTDEWGNGGRSVVTYVTRDKELRVAHEPNKGDYMCQAKLVLTPTAKGTKLDYWEQYTDESSPKDMEATAGKMETEMVGTLSAIKRGCEKK